ncbi:MAG TPA: hypothetical protein VGV62_12625 [Xanthobacteraceae bacterium]|nr:hypothetical protein [Xanthobacteraceae bacterium]
MFVETISPEILQLTIERATFAKHRRDIAEAVTSIDDRITSSREVIAARRTRSSLGPTVCSTPLSSSRDELNPAALS